MDPHKHQMDTTAKLEKLKCKAVELHPQGLHRWVANLLERSVTPDRVDVLKKRLNCAPVLNKLPLDEITAAVEEGAKRLNLKDTNDLCGYVWGVIHRTSDTKTT